MLMTLAAHIIEKAAEVELRATDPRIARA